MEMHSDANELRELVARMNTVAQRTYALFFSACMGSDCHAFLEINGIISKYVDLCARAARDGVDFRQCNVHTGQALPVEGHDVDYLVEKLGCMFGPALAAKPELRDRFLQGLRDAMT